MHFSVRSFDDRLYLDNLADFYPDSVRLEAISNNKETMSDSGFCSV